jgi:hypothetical protein
VVAVAVLAVLVFAGTALAAYPPVPPKPPRAKCAISTIINRRVAILCNAGRARAGKRASIKIGKLIVARGLVRRDGFYLARFTLRKRLTRGTMIRFLVAGRIVATVRA